MTEFDFIETPEHVELQRRLAGIGTRFIAGLLDTLILTALLLVVWVLMLATVGRPLGAELTPWQWAIYILLWYAIYWGYFVFFEMRTNGQSPGKKSQKIRVVKDGGGPITFTDVAIRNLLRVVDGIGGYAVAGFVMFFTRKAQRLGDLAAGTVVVSEASTDYTARSDKRAKLQWEQEATAEALRATGLTPEEYRVLTSYWSRRSQLTVDARQRILVNVIGPILQRTGQAPALQSVMELEQYAYHLILKAAAAQPPPPGAQPAPPGAQPPREGPQ